MWLLWGGLALVASTATYVVTAGQLLLAVLVVDGVLLIALLAIALVGGVVPAAAGADGDVERDRELGG